MEKTSFVRRKIDLYFSSMIFPSLVFAHPSHMHTICSSLFRHTEGSLSDGMYLRTRLRCNRSGPCYGSKKTRSVTLPLQICVRRFLFHTPAPYLGSQTPQSPQMILSLWIRLRTFEANPLFSGNFVVRDIVVVDFFPLYEGDSEPRNELPC